MNRDWQDAVLDELGVSQSGLAMPPQSQPPAGPAAQSPLVPSPAVGEASTIQIPAINGTPSGTPQSPPGPPSPAPANDQAPKWVATVVRDFAAATPPLPPESPAASAARNAPARPNAPAPPLSPGDLVVRPAHGDPPLRRMSRGVLRTVGASTSRDVHDRTTRATGLQRPVTTGRRIVVTSVRGGAGKSTVSALVGTVFSYYRQDRVLVIDADPGLGSLPLRLGAIPNRTIRDLARGKRPASFDDLKPYLNSTHTGLWLLAGAGSAGTVVDETADESETAIYCAVAADLSRFFGVTVIDCGGGPMGAPTAALMADAHAHLLVTPATPDGAFSARSALDWMAARDLGALVRRTLAVFVTHAPHAGADLTRAAEMLRPDGVGVLGVGYDRHLATGAPIDQNRLAESTRVAAERIAAQALAQATSQEAQ